MPVEGSSPVAPEDQPVNSELASLLILAIRLQAVFELAEPLAAAAKIIFEEARPVALAAQLTLICRNHRTVSQTMKLNPS